MCSATDTLRDLSKDPDEAVHDARKDLKKLRALLRLVRDGLGEVRYRKENRALRNAGRALAHFRDAAVRVELVEKLQETTAGGASTEALRMADERVTHLYELVHAKGRLRHAAKEARKQLKRAKERIRKWRLEETAGFALFRAGLLRSYAEGRESFARCLIHPTAGNFHEWRKQCKYLRHQLGFLKNVSPEMNLLVAALHELSERLGENHDQTVLAETLEPLARQDVALEGLAAIHEELEGRHRGRMDESLAAGGSFFSAVPEDFIAMIGGWWAHGQAPAES